MREMLVGPNFGEFEECLLFALPRCVFAVANILPEGIFSANQMMRMFGFLVCISIRRVFSAAGVARSKLFVPMTGDDDSIFDICASREYATREGARSEVTVRSGLRCRCGIYA